MGVSNPKEDSNQARLDKGASARFQTTLWTAVRSAGDHSSPRSEAALAQLCQTYWMPVYAFIRKRGSPREEAADLTQSFFAKFLEMNTVARADRGRGRFRSFIMSSLGNFLCDEHDRASALKRGGGKPILSLDFQHAELEFSQESTKPTTPSTTFEKHWATTLLNRVMQRVEAEQRQNGRGDLFEHLQRHLWGDSDSVPYGELARRLGMSMVNLRVSAHRIRQRYREILREEIADTVDTDAEIEGEIRHLMRVVSL